MLAAIYIQLGDVSDKETKAGFSNTALGSSRAGSLEGF
jgi:hypothetical protein